jgi:hypothetical protein
MEYSM